MVGALAVYWVLNSQGLIGAMLAISGGIFLYLGAIDFLPQVARGSGSRWEKLVPLMLGVGLMLIVILAIPHGD